MKNIRYHLFWLLDTLKGSPIKSHFNEIKGVFNNPYNDKSQKIKYQRLDELLQYVLKTTSFYRNLDISDNIDLSKFPIINKSIIKDNFNDFLSDNYVDKQEQLRKMSTSGSTGIPFFVYQDKKKVIRSKADLIYFYELGNFYVGDRLYFLRIWNDLNRKTKFSCWKENFVMSNTSDLSLDGLKVFVSHLKKDKQEKVIMGYASFFETIAQYADILNCEKTKVKSIIPGAESLSSPAKITLKKMFNCPVYMRYSNQENGILAQQIDDTDDYYINEASYKIEFLKMEEDIEAKENELARVIVTDLFNYAMPIIRYDTGDLARYCYEKDFRGNKRKIIKIIEGRKRDSIYNTKGELVSSSSITVSMWKYVKDIIQFQFIQKTSNVYLMKLNCDCPFFNESELKKDLCFYLGEDAIISFEYVNEIPQLSSGKRKAIINEWGNQ